MKKKLLILSIGFISLGIIFLSGFFIPSLTMSSPTPLPKDHNLYSQIENDLLMGNPEAEIVLIEYSDFQCPFCRRFWLETFPQLKKDYVDSGRVLFVTKDYPLYFHPQAIDSAIAVECAAEQNRGWEMHDLIFKKQAQLGRGTISYNNEDLKNWANELGIDISDCLDEQRYYSEVMEDLEQGKEMGVTATPTFVIINKETGLKTTIVGAQSYSAFRDAFEKVSRT